MEDLSQDMNAWREKQSKRDKLSNEMGQYLLRGYRMLDLCCEECNNILMSGPGTSSSTLCIHCNQQQDTQKVQESNVGNSECGPIPLTTPVDPIHKQTLPLNEESAELATVGGEEYVCFAVELAKKALLSKLVWASGELERSPSSLEYIQQLCMCIQTLSKTLEQLKNNSLL